MEQGNPEQQIAILKVLCSYLLFERKQESQLGMAFSALVQERHNHFHTVSGDRKDGDGTDFSDCKNDLCITAYNILKDSRSMAIEVNDMTIRLIADYNLTIQKVGYSCRAWLSEKSKLEVPQRQLIIP